ncbi:hypothetical protein OROMI_004219 [Orobanche minor]
MEKYAHVHFMQISLSQRKPSGGGFENILVIGAGALSRCVDWTNRGSCIPFGDAAGAMLLCSYRFHKERYIVTYNPSKGRIYTLFRYQAKSDDILKATFHGFLSSC